MSDTVYQCAGCQRVFLTRLNYELHICTYVTHSIAGATRAVPTAEPTDAPPTAESDSYRARAERLDQLLAQRVREIDFVMADRNALTMQLAACQALLSRAQDYIAHDGHYACTITDCQCGMYALSAEIAAALAPLDPLVPTPLEVADAEVARLHAALDGKPQPAPPRRRPAAACRDCGMQYPFGLDAVMPNDQWSLIMGQPESKDDPGGLLCATCICKRAEQLPDFVRARLVLE